MAADERKEDTTNSDAQTAYDITSFATPKLKFTEEYSTDKGTPTQINESERLDLAKKILLYLFCFASVVIAGSASIIWLRSPCSGNGATQNLSN